MAEIDFFILGIINDHPNIRIINYKTGQNNIDNLSLNINWRGNFRWGVHYINGVISSNNVKKPADNAGNADNLPTKLVNSLDENISIVKKVLDEPSDLVIREFVVGQKDHKCAIVYIDGLVDKDLIQNSILENLYNLADSQEVPEEALKLLDEIFNDIISVSNIVKSQKLDDVLIGILSGKTVLYVDGINTVLIADTMGGESRSIEQPVTETVVRGPRDGFVETLGTNLSLIRRYIQDPKLRFKSHRVGRRRNKDLVVAYIEDIVNPALLKEVNRRIDSIDIDNPIESGYIEQWIEDSFLSPFPQILDSERPDKVAIAMLSGKVAILLDGTPFVLMAPTVIGDILQSPEDYYERWIIGTLLRLLRYIAAFISIFLPALYIALISFQQGLLPSKLAFSIAASREGVPFPPVIEAFLMVATLELLQEAGVRLPTPIGQTIGIVGGLVIGDAAVNAGIVSPIMVIIIALTAISAYANPSFSAAISLRIIRFGFMAAAATFGLYGIILAYIMVNIHIVNLKSFGVPYSTPFSPTLGQDWKDLVIRAPMTMLTKRPKYLQPKDNKSADKGVQDS